MKPINAQSLLVTAALGGALAVGAGAFGAHGLEGRLSPERLQSWETASRYLMYHSLAVAGIAALLIGHPQQRRLGLAGLWMLLGTGIFSGSLYILCLTGVHWLVWLTPFGGLMLIAGWLQLALAAYRWHSESRAV